MTLKVSLDGGTTWSACTPSTIDFEQYPTLLLRFVDGGEEELPSWLLSQNMPSASALGSIHNRATTR
jgi:hypothetical protein